MIPHVHPHPDEREETRESLVDKGSQLRGVTDDIPSQLEEFKIRGREKQYSGVGTTALVGPLFLAFYPYPICAPCQHLPNFFNPVETCRKMSLDPSLWGADLNERVVFAS